MLLFSFTAFIILASAMGAVYHWPDYRFDSLEESLYTAFGFDTFVGGCTLRNSGQDPDAPTTVAAQWLRIAYHDMATHNADDGTGGADASIVFELDRPQNVGAGMLATLVDFIPFVNFYVGIADVIAAGAVTALTSCGGPAIPFRAGRIEATAAGPPTVPEPQQDLDSHIASFKRQGFNQSEMIALVACGHTLGGVRSVDFPLTVPSDVPNGFANFDSTHQYDNTVVTEYLSGTTKNPLVVGKNTTTNSDLRIFSSDGNVTMHSIANAADFSNTCAALIERMINTVPTGVSLADPIELIEHKVNEVKLYPKDGSLVLNATLRLLNPSLDANITMHWIDHEGSFCPTAGCSVASSRTTSVGVSEYALQLGFVGGFVQYEFSALVPVNNSVSKFWFEIVNGTSPIIVDNGGSGFQIENDVVLYDPYRSTTRISAQGQHVLRAVVAVKQNVNAQLSMQAHEIGPDSGPFPALLRTIELQPDTQHMAADGYTFFAANYNGNATSILVNGVVNGKKYEAYVDPSDITGPQ